ncbi:putative immunoglobulin-blocking virulence protein [Mesomycoplasma flocculare]|uniref:putative immunoglobulin-blocking virulence protein n=1 Tax=Mesomycoplasma flocculare TaxID=2128 RepID=UPI00136D5AD1|nr:putative immunoglobulin-blocking virulence protein [Mesomycoplasma flocculare]MXR05773.1 putative immunoglobulin-blocking virulence protein [Mesomycoplasma flocculare]
MVLYLSKRKKMIVGGSAAFFALGISFSISENLYNHYYSSPLLITYSQASPSTIAKNRPNQTGFSPVTNAKFIPIPLKETELKKKKKTIPEIPIPKVEKEIIISKPVEKIEPKVEKEIIISKPVEKIEPKVEIIEEPAAPIETPVPVPIPAEPIKKVVSPSYSYSEPQNIEKQPEITTKTKLTPSFGQIESAKANWKIGIKNQITITETNIRKHDKKIAEYERQIREDYDIFYKGKISKESFEESVRYQIWVENNYKKREQDYLQILKEDQIRGPQFSASDLKLIERGMTVSKENHHIWNFVNPDDNPVIGKNGTYRKRNERRVLNTPGWAPRSPFGIANQEFEGWTKSDISQEFQSEINEILGSNQNSDSIKIYKYTPNDQNPNKSSKSEIKAVSLDANDENAFNKFQEFLKKTAGKKIDAVVLKNVGSTKQGQNISQILAALPENVQKLTLFLDDQKAINGLYTLRGKKLKELELYSNTKPIDDYWAINPNAVADVDYISFDYNNPASYHKNTPDEKIPGSIIFDTLRWDKNDSEQTITEGLRIAFGSKIYERPFQGRYGGKGGYPTNLDFSDTNIKTIKNLKFDEIDNLFNENLQNWKEDKYAQEDYHGFKKLKFVYLYFGVDQNSTQNLANSQTNKSFSASVSDFEGAQYTERLSGIQDPFVPPAAVIYFRENGQSQQNVVFNLTGTPSEDAKKQLKAFVEATNRGYPFAKIVVDSEEIKQELIKYYQENANPEKRKRSQGKFAERELEVKNSTSSK